MHKHNILVFDSVCSILTYGPEAWDLTETVRKKINGANSVMLSVITGKTPKRRGSRDNMQLQPSEGDTSKTPAVAGPHPEARRGKVAAACGEMLI